MESYSIKRLEPLCGYARQVDLRDATVGLIAFEAALDDETAEGENDRRRVVAGYNEDDCRATLVLRDWLESRRMELAARLSLPESGLPRPVVEEKPGPAEDPELAEIRAALVGLLQAAGLTRFSPVKPQRWVIASFEHHCGPHGVAHPHIHNIVVAALTTGPG